MRFYEIRDRLFSAFTKRKLDFKVYGGAAINVYDNTRLTEDIDMVIEKTMAAADKFVAALVDCGYGTADEIYDGLFGADLHTEEYLFSTNRIISSNPEYDGFYLDLTFEFGSIVYDDVETEVYDLNGLRVNIATPEQLLDMKRRINPSREKDAGDIELLERKVIDSKANPELMNLF